MPPDARLFMDPDSAARNPIKGLKLWLTPAQIVLLMIIVVVVGPQMIFIVFVVDLLDYDVLPNPMINGQILLTSLITPPYFGSFLPSFKVIDFNACSTSFSVPTGLSPTAEMSGFLAPRRIGVM